MDKIEVSISDLQELKAWRDHLKKDGAYVARVFPRDALDRIIGAIPEPDPITNEMVDRYMTILGRSSASYSLIDLRAAYEVFAEAGLIRTEGDK